MNSSMTREEILEVLSGETIPLDVREFKGGELSNGIKKRILTMNVSDSVENINRFWTPLVKQDERNIITSSRIFHVHFTFLSTCFHQPDRRAASNE